MRFTKVMAYKVPVIAVIFSLHFLQVESPALTTSSTDGLNLQVPYVTSEKENELCFYEPGKPIPEGLYVRCGPGYHAQIDDRLSPCHLCARGETYQPKVNHCEKCILCTDCSALGKEVEKNCTLTTDTVCKDAIPQNSDDAFTTDPNVQYSSSHSPSLGVSTTTSQTLPRNETDPPDCPLCIGQVDQKDTSWILPVVLAVTIVVLLVTVVLLLCCVCFQRRRYKSKIGQLKEQITNPNNNEGIVPNHTPPAETDNEDIVLNHIPPAEAGNGPRSAAALLPDNGPRSTDALLPDNGPRSTDPLLPDDGPRSTDPLLPDNEDTSFNYTTEAEVHNGNTNQPNREEHNGPRSTDPLLSDNGPRSTDPLLSDNEDSVFNYTHTTEAEVHNGDTNQPNHEEESQDDNTARWNNGSVETAV